MKRSGAVILVVLVISGLAAMVAAGVLFAVLAERSAGLAASGANQADAAVMSGLQVAMAAIEQGLDVWDDPATFCNRIVCQDGADTWHFTVYAPAGDGTVRYGLNDEASRININLADEAALARLPGMTQELVDCLLDYRDEDTDPRPAGAEAEFYGQLAVPYEPRNGLLTTIEELLMVKGFCGSIVYGEDANLNGILDPNENDGKDSFPLDDGDGRLNAGLRGLATTISYELNVDREGRPRNNINEPSANIRAAGLPRQTAQFVQLYLADGNAFRHPSELLNLQYTLKKNHGSDPQTRAGQVIRSGVGRAELANVVDRLMVPAAGGRAMVQTGLVNVNTAPLEVLTLIGMDESLAQQVISARANLDAERKSTIAWLYTDGPIADARTFKALAPLLTARSFQYRAQVVGFAAPSGRFKVIEAVIDTVSPRSAQTGRRQPRVVYLRDLTRLGLPFAPDFEQYPPR